MYVAIRCPHVRMCVRILQLSKIVWTKAYPLINDLHHPSNIMCVNNVMSLCVVVELSTNLELRKVWDHESFPHIELVEKHDGYDTVYW